MYCVISSRRDKYRDPEASIFNIIAETEPMIPAYTDAPASMLQMVTHTSDSSCSAAPNRSGEPQCQWQLKIYTPHTYRRCSSTVANAQHV